MTAKNGGIDIRNIHIFLGYLLKFILFEPLRITELVLYRGKIHRHQLTADPIFILGHWRSGTSYLQEQISANESYTTTTIFRFLFADSYILGEKWLKPILNWVCRTFNIPYSFQRTTMNMDLVGELESAMCQACSPYSYTWGHLFPSKFTQWVNQMILLEDNNNKEGWIADYDFLIRKLSFHSMGKRVVVKSPGDTARASILLKKYPNAKFLYIERDPTAVLKSNQYLWNVIIRENSIHRISESEIDQHIKTTLSTLKSSYYTFKNLVPKNQLIEISFDELISDTPAVLRTVQNQLELS